VLQDPSSLVLNKWNIEEEFFQTLKSRPIMMHGIF
jgi:hypothetical protein